MFRFFVALTLVSAVATSTHAGLIVDEFDVTQELAIGGSTTLIFDGPVDIGGGVTRTIGMAITTSGGEGLLRVNSIGPNQAVLTLGNRDFPDDPFNGLGVLQYDYPTPIDLTQFGASGAFRLNIETNSFGFAARVAVTDTAGELSETLLVPLPEHLPTNPNLDFDIPFSGFFGSADFENIAKIELIVTRDVARMGRLELERFEIIPEPASVVLLSLGGLMLLHRRERAAHHR